MPHGCAVFAQALLVGVGVQPFLGECVGLEDLIEDLWADGGDLVLIGLLLMLELFEMLGDQLV